MSKLGAKNIHTPMAQHQEQVLVQYLVKRNFYTLSRWVRKQTTNQSMTHSTPRPWPPHCHN